MGYLVDQMEKLAKETERSLGDKALLAGGALAGVGAANTGMTFAENLAVGSDAGVRSTLANAGVKNLEPRKGIKGIVDKANIGNQYRQLLFANAMESGTRAGHMAQAAGKGTGTAALTTARTTAEHIWKGLPKKVRLLAALGIPVTVAGGYGGYKGVEALLKD